MLDDLLSRSGLADFLAQILGNWNSVKIFVEHLTGVSHDLLHLLVGFGAWLLLAAVTRRTIASALPLALTFALAAINEAADLWVEIWPDRAMQYGELAKDLVITISVPLILFAAARVRPALFDIRRR